MQRRAFMALLGGVSVTPFLPPHVVRAQSDNVRQVALVLSFPEADAEIQKRVQAFRDSLAKQGWLDGRNVKIGIYWESTGARVAVVAPEVVRSAPQVIVAAGSPNAEALQRQTRTIPIIMVGSSDPAASGLVANLARPGGNLTGFMNYEFSIATKWLATLKELAPTLRRVLFVMQAGNVGQQGLLSALENAAPSLQVQIVQAVVRERADIERAIEAFAKIPDGGLIVPPNNVALRERDMIVALCARHRLPAIYGLRPYVAAGGLMSYDTDISDIYRRAAGYVDRILRGEKAADLPVQGATKFELAINLRAAKALGITVPLALLSRADEVLE